MAICQEGKLEILVWWYRELNVTHPGRADDHLGRLFRLSLGNSSAKGSSRV